LRVHLSNHLPILPSQDHLHGVESAYLGAMKQDAKSERGCQRGRELGPVDAGDATAENM